MSTAVIGRPVINKHKVSSKEWAKWSNARKKRFNKIMHVMRPGNQLIFMPPGRCVIRSEWNIIRFRTALALSKVD